MSASMTVQHTKRLQEAQNLPWIEFLLDSWLGVVLGPALDIASRIFAPAAEVELSRVFGASWRAYNRHVKLHWL